MAQAKTLTKQELKRVLDVVAVSGKHALRNRVMILMTHYCGMRIGEVASLRVGNVLGSDGRILEQIVLSVEQTKGSRSRVVYVPKRMCKELDAYVATLKRKGSDDYLFPSQKARCLSANSACQLVNRLYKTAGLVGATSHSGRRTLLTDLSEKGVSVFVLAELAGHRHISTTQRYVMVNEQMLKNAINL